MNNQPTVALIGAGAMGGALLRGWLGKGVIAAAGSALFEPAPAPALVELARAHRILLNPDLEGLAVDAVILAVKPQAAAEALPRFETLARSALVVSVMAGASTAALHALIGEHARIVRAMPNLPASIGEGATGMFAAPDVSPADRLLAERLMSAVGIAIWVDSERAIDVVTAISGSGPAYVFLLAEALADAGTALGLTPDQATALARATVEGAGALLRADSRSAAALRAAVTSPGGTTQAALSVLDGEGRALRDLIENAARRAASRARELTR